MVTKEQAKSLVHGTILHFTGSKPCVRHVGPRGGVEINVVRVRVSGNCQTWVRQPNKFRLPIIHGMRDYGAINDDNAHYFHLESDCPLNGASHF